MRELSAVVVAWNCAGTLGACVRSLRVSAASAGEVIEIIVVLNPSEDDSELVARREGVDILVENPVNVGFSFAANQGIAVADAEWVLLANPDLVVSEGFVEAILSAIRSPSAERVATLVPEVRFAANSSVINTRGIFVDKAGIPGERGAGAVIDPDSTLEVFGGSGGAAAFNVKALIDVGGFEPAFFAYLEDVDLAWRLRKRGFSARIVPDAEALHVGSASTGEGSHVKNYLVARNRRLLFRIHGPRGFRACFWRNAVDVAHLAVQGFSTRSSAPLEGRLAALQRRRHARFLAAAYATSGCQLDATPSLAPRQRLRTMLRRKRATGTLMH